MISLGAGVQSSAVLMLALEGQIQADCAIFADTGWEPRAVYQHLEQLEQLAAKAGFPVHRVTNGNIRTLGAGFGSASAMDAPFFLVNQRGEPGMARRQCTSKFKIQPIRRRARQLMQDAGERQIEQLFGISVDEYQRVRTSDVKYVTHIYPLIDLGWRRSDCQRYLEKLGLAAPRSACVGCPFHSDHEWRKLRDESPAEFADAVQWEREIQAHGLKVDAMPYVHAQRVPLDQVDLSTREDHGQLRLEWDDECFGMCGV